MLQVVAPRLLVKNSNEELTPGIDPTLSALLLLFEHPPSVGPILSNQRWAECFIPFRDAVSPFGHPEGVAIT
jgi:hypothetical protein